MNWGGGAVPLWGSWVPIEHNVAGAEAYLHAKFHLDLSNRLATIHQCHRQTDRTGQRSDSIRRTVLQTVAQKSHVQTSRDFLYVLSGLVARSFFEDNGIRDVAYPRFCG